MLLLVASRADAGAADLVRRWHRHDAHVLTCDSLSRAGWIFDPADPAGGRLVVDGATVPVSVLRGVVSLLPVVDAGELPHIAPEEREYVAGEMTAFLLAWLDSLPCPVLGRPTPLCLTGPHLRHEQWVRAALRVGLEVRPSVRRVPGARGADDGLGAGAPDASGQVLDVVVAGGRAVVPDVGEPVDPGVVAGVVAMAAAEGADLLTVSLGGTPDGVELLGVTPTVAVGRHDVADAVLAALGVEP